ncbi:hypothetical protein D3C72_1829470 [compost metagenome]
MQLFYHLQRVRERVAVGGQDEAHIARLAGICQLFQRREVQTHVAIGRIDHGGAAVEDVVAAQQQAVFFQHQAHMVGRMAGGVDGAQGVAVGGAIRVAQHQCGAIGQLTVWRELTASTRRGGRRQAPDHRGGKTRLGHQRLQRGSAGRMVWV